MWMLAQLTVMVALALLLELSIARSFIAATVTVLAREGQSAAEEAAETWTVRLSPGQKSPKLQFSVLDAIEQPVTAGETDQATLPGSGSFSVTL